MLLASDVILQLRLVRAAAARQTPMLLRVGDVPALAASAAPGDSELGGASFSLPRPFLENAVVPVPPRLVGIGETLGGTGLASGVGAISFIRETCFDLGAIFFLLASLASGDRRRDRRCSSGPVGKRAGKAQDRPRLKGMPQTI